MKKNQKRHRLDDPQKKLDQRIYKWISRSRSSKVVEFVVQNPEVAEWLSFADPEMVEGIALKDDLLIIRFRSEDLAQLALQKEDELLKEFGLYLALIAELNGWPWLYSSNRPEPFNPSPRIVTIEEHAEDIKDLLSALGEEVQEEQDA